MVSNGDQRWGVAEVRLSELTLESSRASGAHEFGGLSEGGGGARGRSEIEARHDLIERALRLADAYGFHASTCHTRIRMLQVRLVPCQAATIERARASPEPPPPRADAPPLIAGELQCLLLRETVAHT